MQWEKDENEVYVLQTSDRYRRYIIIVCDSPIKEFLFSQTPGECASQLEELSDKGIVVHPYYINELDIAQQRLDWST